MRAGGGLDGRPSHHPELNQYFFSVLQPIKMQCEEHLCLVERQAMRVETYSAHFFSSRRQGSLPGGKLSQ